MVSIFICGDIINRFSDQNFIGPQLASVIKNADYAIGNFEGVLSCSSDSSLGMIERPSTLSTLKESGFDMLLLSNNHIGDYSEKGFTHTLNEIDKAGFDKTGAGFTYEEAYKPFVKEIKGIRFGFINVCEALCCLYKNPNQKYGTAWTGAKDLERIIPATKKEVDYLIVLPHSGLELYDYPLEHTRELYRHYCDLGADCVAAAHPHVPQGLEEYNGHLIFYSLGNFFFPESRNCNSSLPTNQSLSVVLTFGGGGEISYKAVYHKTEKLIVELCKKPEKDIELLSSYLCEPTYSQNVGKQNESVFDKQVFGLYMDSVLGVARSYTLKEKIKLVLRLLRPIKTKQRNVFLKSFHKMIQSETYINLIDSAIKNKSL